MKQLKRLEDCALFLLKTPGWNIGFGDWPAMRRILDSPMSPRSAKEKRELYEQCLSLYDRRCYEWKSVLLMADRAKRNFYPNSRNITPEDVIFLRVQGIDPEVEQDPD